MDIDEELIYTTTRIVCSRTDGKASFGTGFFFNFCVDPDAGTVRPAIVTNKHVLEKVKEIVVVFNESDGASSPMPTGKHLSAKLIPNQNCQIIMHPYPKIDLCIITIAPILEIYAKQGIRLFYKALRKDLIVRESDYEAISEIEDVIFIGYPDTLYDSVNNRPIVRKGLTATSIKLDFEGRPEFLIDGAIYGGSSGSPVYLYQEGLINDGKNKFLIGKKFTFLGVVSSVFKHRVAGEIGVADFPQPTVMGISPDSFIPNNLGVVIKANQLDIFEKILDKMG